MSGDLSVRIAAFAFCCDLASSGAFGPLANWANAGDFGAVLGVSGLKRKRRGSRGVKPAFLAPCAQNSLLFGSCFGFGG